MTRYQIRIKGQLYESSTSYDVALQLYKTVDKTSLRQYYGCTKSLVKLVDDKEEIIRTDKIKSVTAGMHL